jgi:hypothetical protein
MSRASASWLSRWQKFIYFFSSTAMFVQFPSIDFIIASARCLRALIDERKDRYRAKN